jgi:imidazoleglycerol-phosphate dehydratase
MRRASLNRRTRETDIRLKLAIEGRGRYDVSTGIRFFDHMLELVARHGAFDLTLRVDGDLDVDQHHPVEDAGIAFGEAIGAALGSRRGIHRAGYFVMPMDETLAVAAVDLSGRPRGRRSQDRPRVGDPQRNWQDFSRASRKGYARVRARRTRRSSHHQEAIRVRPRPRRVLKTNSSDALPSTRACCDNRASERASEA